MKKFSIAVIVIIIVLALAYYFYNSGSFSAEIDGVSVEALSSVAEYSNGKLSISFLLKESGKKTITIKVNALKAGIYPLNSVVDGGNGAGYACDGAHGRIVFVTNNKNAGIVNLTELDLNSKSVSGTFEFTAHQIVENGFGAQVVRVKMGSFEDVQIK